MYQTATFGAGCFWGVEETFSQLAGVVSTQVGYAGGTTENPSYEQVCSHATGQVEVVQLIYDPSIISFAHLLTVFWRCHQPTTMDRQGPDRGSQYRSVIFYHSKEQQQTAQYSKEALQATLQEKIVTQILPATKFYPAEDYHQKYFKKHHKRS